jgi:hypothetical protein
MSAIKAGSANQLEGMKVTQSMEAEKPDRKINGSQPCTRHSPNGHPRVLPHARLAMTSPLKNGDSDDSTRRVVTQKVIRGWVKEEQRF